MSACIINIYYISIKYEECIKITLTFKGTFIDEIYQIVHTYSYNLYDYLILTVNIISLVYVFIIYQFSLSYISICIVQMNLGPKEQV